ncbi:MAG: uroporphyrinogen decarboxylase family protein [Spirochaetota bacterium]
MNMTDEIKALFDRLSELAGGEENRRRLAMWPERFRPSAYEPGLIPPLAREHREEKRPPLSADWDRLQWSRLLGFDISRYYTDPLCYLRWTLEINLFRFDRFLDDTPLTRTVPIFLGVAMEPNFFGVPILYSDRHEPLFTSDGAVVRERGDLVKLKVPDFRRAGLMPLARRFYDTIRSLAPEGWAVDFPVWLRGPFGVACGIRGMQALLVDMIDDPPLVHELMALIVEARGAFTRVRREITGGEEIEHGCAENDLANDEVSVPIVSPELCEELILPYEQKLEERYGGVHWWHSCGNKTPLVPAIQRAFDRVGFVDFALWSDDLQRAVRALDPGIPFHVRPAARDIAERGEEIIRNSIAGIFSVCRGRSFALRVDGLQPERPGPEQVAAVQRYLRLARRVGEEHAELWGG